MTRRTTITIHSRELITIRSQANWTEGWCEQCAALAPMASPEQAAALAGIKTRVVYRWIEASLLHFTETGEGHLLVCLDSLGIERPSRAGAPDPASAPGHCGFVDYSTRRDAPGGNEARDGVDKEAPTFKLMTLTPPPKSLGATLK